MREDLTERWLPIPGWEGRYEVSDRGNVRRVVRNMRLTPDAAGYRRVALWRGNRGSSFLVHALVMAAFQGPRPAGMDIDHLNAVKSDNRFANLEYVTRVENMTRSLPARRKTQVRGERSPFAKITEADVRAMRDLAAAGMGYRELARRFGVAYPTARNIVRRERWAHVD